MNNKRSPSILKVLVFIIFLLVYSFLFVLPVIRFIVMPTIDNFFVQRSQRKVVTTPKTKEECIEKSGEWRRPGPWPRETCMIPYADGGKTCIAGFQCEAGDCFYSSGPWNQMKITSGKCPKYQIYFGCIQEVHFGITGKAVCLD